MTDHTGVAAAAVAPPVAPKIPKIDSVHGLGAVAVSDDGRRLAYTTGGTGFRQYTLAIEDLRTGAFEPERIEQGRP